MLAQARIVSARDSNRNRNYGSAPKLASRLQARVPQPRVNTRRVTRAALGKETEGAKEWAVDRRTLMAAGTLAVTMPIVTERSAANAMVTGYEKDVGGFSFAVLQHETPKFNDWYKVFNEKWGKQGPPDFGVVRTLVGKGKGVETDGDSLCVVIVFPNDKLSTIAPFYDQKKNPLWAEAREAGWLTGTFHQSYVEPKIWRGYPGDSGPPPLKGKAFGVYSAKLGIPLDPDFIGSFTSPDSDKLHDANGVLGSVVGTTLKGSDIGTKDLSVTHFHGSYKKACGLVDQFNSRSPPFDGIVAAGVLKEPIEGMAYEVVADTIDLDAIQKIMAASA